MRTATFRRTAKPNPGPPENYSVPEPFLPTVRRTAPTTTKRLIKMTAPSTKCSIAVLLVQEKPGTFSQGWGGGRFKPFLSRRAVVAAPLGTRRKEHATATVVDPQECPPNRQLRGTPPASEAAPHLRIARG